MENRAIFSGKLLAYLLVLPQFAISLIFFYWPAAQALWQSFLVQDAFGLSTEFVWFENYVNLLQTPEYYQAIGVTFTFSALVVFFSLSIGLLLAVMANRNIPGVQIYRTFLIIPYAVAPAVASVLFIFMFQPGLGMIARVLQRNGIDWNPVLNGTQAMILVVIVAVWNQISYNFLFFLAGLQAIPKSVIEAAAIDGARPMRRFWTIVFPLLSPTTFFLIIVNITYVFFNTLGIIDTATGGGPNGATQTLVYKVFQDGKVGADLGGSAAQSVILMVIVVAAHRIPVSLRRKEGSLLNAMIEHRRFGNLLPHLVLLAGVAIVAFPVYLAVIASTHDNTVIANGQMPLYPGTHALETYWNTIVSGTGKTTRAPVGGMMLNSLIMAIGIAVGKIAISIISAYAIVFFAFPFRMTAFWTIFITLMLPVEVRIFPTYKITSDLHMLDSYAGLILPLIASATATLLFRQFFMTVPKELVEASKMDGAGPIRFFFDTLLPLSVTNIAALFVILFIYGWNQYLWPLLITTRDDMQTIVIGIKKIIDVHDALTEWSVAMATAVLAMLPPVAVVVLMQRLFVKGLIETEK